MNMQEDAFAGAGLGQGGAGPEGGDYTEEEKEQMARVQEAQDELRKKLFEKQQEEQRLKDQRKQEGMQ